MNRVTINLEALHHNIQVVSGWMDSHVATWTLTTKALCGHPETIKALGLLGIRSMADSRLMNLSAIREQVPGCETWYLRLPHMSAIDKIVSLADVSLNSEKDVIKAIDEEARRQGKIHRIIIMIELGDLREGILPGSLVQFYQSVFELPNIEVMGIGANLGCLSGTVPNLDQMTQLALYRELLELKFGHSLRTISAGSSAVLPMLLAGTLPRSINHFRIGESVFLGTDLLSGGSLPGLRDDAVMLEAEVAEVKEKSLVALGETTDLSPFGNPAEDEQQQPGQRGYRALVTVGQVDTDVAGLTPANPDYRIAGASSDITVVNVGEERGDIRVGNSLKFKLNYSSLVRLMNDKYIDVVLEPGLDEFAERLDTEHYQLEVPPIYDDIAAQTAVP